MDASNWRDLHLYMLWCRICMLLLVFAGSFACDTSRARREAQARQHADSEDAGSEAASDEDAGTAAALGDQDAGATEPAVDAGKVGPPRSGSCGPAFERECLSCLAELYPVQTGNCFGPDWTQRRFGGPCQSMMECICDASTPSTECAALATPECGACWEAWVKPYASGYCTGRCNAPLAEPEPDLCAEVRPLTAGRVDGTTAGSTLQVDLWEHRVFSDVDCSDQLPGRGLLYSVQIPGAGALRARVIGPGMHVLLSESCSSVVDSCRSYGPIATSSAPELWLSVDSALFDSGQSFTLFASREPPACGDGLLDPSEQCDDGNQRARDGCDASCRVETGYVCRANQACRALICGDGWVEPPAERNDSDASFDRWSGGSEACDDGNTADGDGCNARCELEATHTCHGIPSRCERRPKGDLCAEPLLLAVQSYDLGAFHSELAYPFDAGPDLFVRSQLAAGETLALTGTSGFEGFIASILSCGQASLYGRGLELHAGAAFRYAVEVGPSAASTPLFAIVARESAPDKTLLVESVEKIAPRCGDEFLTSGEGCDDGNSAPGDGCNACQVEPGFACPPTGACHSIRCGDGRQEAGEACDDGNTSAGDGCSATCDVES